MHRVAFGMVLPALCAPSWADRVSSQFGVSATVVPACSGVSATKPSDGQTVVMVNCSQATAYTVNLSGGSGSASSDNVRTVTIAGAPLHAALNQDSDRSAARGQWTKSESFYAVNHSCANKFFHFSYCGTEDLPR